MYDQVLKALSKGFSAQQILDYIVKKFPKQSSPIQKALAMGFTADQLVRYFGGGKKAVNKWMDSTQNNEEINTEHARTQAQDISEQQSRNKTALGIGGVALGAAMTPLASSMASSALSRAAPTSIQKLAPELLPVPSNISPASSISNPSQPPVTGAQLQPIAANIAQSPNIAQPIPAQRDPQKNIELIKNVKEDQRIGNLLSGGMSPKDIAAFIKKVSPKEVSKALESAEGGIEAAIEDFAQSMQQPEQEVNQPEQTIDKVTPEIAPQAEIEKEELPIEEKTFAKSDVVMTPKGIAEVKALRNGKAIIEVDGKKFEMREDELEPTEFTEDEIADAYDDLMSKIPEEHRSGFIQWAGYDEDRNVLGFIPRGGKYEELTDITPEEAKAIKEGTGTARTTGENREGLWVAGEDTRGGIISQIIHDRRKGNKANDEKQLKLFDLPKKEKEDRGMKPLFDEMAHARNLSHERERKKKLEERERKKRERDEAKKRKK